ncbi:MAG: hypothetical protein IJA20_01945 [Methanocorpusculum sp.]|nr:hypothetical protein [Oscillospiraceae bacterium]MBQ3569414.1 hypothetical protein [Methanocorpusculum sp.]
MKKNRTLGFIFAALAILLSNVMCAVVGYNYSSMLWGIQYAGYSAPANTAFLLAIPYAVGIVICAVVSHICFRKAKTFANG